MAKRRRIPEEYTEVDHWLYDPSNLEGGHLIIGFKIDRLHPSGNGETDRLRVRDIRSAIRALELWIDSCVTEEKRG